jgi:hypothetical protein
MSHVSLKPLSVNIQPFASKMSFAVFPSKLYKEFPPPNGTLFCLEAAFDAILIKRLE